MRKLTVISAAAIGTGYLVYDLLCSGPIFNWAVDREEEVIELAETLLRFQRVSRLRTLNRNEFAELAAATNRLKHLYLFYRPIADQQDRIRIDRALRTANQLIETQLRIAAA